VDDYRKRAQVGMLHISIEGYNSTHRSMIHTVNLSTPTDELRTSRRFGETGFAKIDISDTLGNKSYSNFMCSNMEGYTSKFEHTHEEWNVEVRLTTAIEFLNIFHSVSQDVLTQDQYFEALYFLYDNHIKHYVGKPELVEYAERKFRTRSDKIPFLSNPKVMGWISILTACVKRNSRPCWVRRASGEPFSQ